MKKLFTLLMVCAVFGAIAQNNPGLKLTINGKNITNISASFGPAMDYDAPLCGEVVPMDSKGGATPTAITKAEGCDDILVDVKGKIALIRRGTCEFGAKALNAQNAGAIAVIIYNREDPANANGPIGMGTGAVGVDVTIPTTMISLEDAQAAIALVTAGTKVTACFTRPGKLMDDVYGNPWGNMTPLSQVDSIAPSVTYINRKDSLSNVVTNCEITDPKGKKTLLTRTHELGVTEEGFVSIIPVANYLPTEKGTYSVKFFGSFLPNDTSKSQFVVSDYTFGNDLGTLTGNGVTRVPATFAGTDLKISNIINAYATGAAASKATYVSFGLRNPAKLKGRTIDISLLESDVDRIDGMSSTTLSVGDIGDLVGDVLTYTITGNEDPNKLIYVKLKDGAKNGIDLVENTPYIVALQYEGSTYKDSIAPEWSLGRTVPTRWPNISSFGAGLMTGASYFSGGWSDTEDPIGHLHIDNFVGTENLVTLKDSEVTIFPNPASSTVNVKLNLIDNAKYVKLGIMDISGRILETKDLNINDGTTPINIAAYPSGVYFFTVKTDKGFATEKVIKE